MPSLFSILTLRSASTFDAAQAPRATTETTNPDLPPSHTNPISQMDPIACPSQLFFSSVIVTAVTPTPSLYVCLTTSSQDGTERPHFTRRKEHAEKLKGCIGKQLTQSRTPPSKASHSHPKPSTLLTCFPI